MARLAVRVEDFEDGAFAPVCVATGGAADRAYARRASYRPSWPVVFILLGPIGWIVMLVAAAGTERTVTGELPMADAAHARLRQARRTQWRRGVEVGVAAVVLTVVLAVLDHGGAALLVGAAGLVAAGAFWTAGSQPKGTVSATLSRNGRTVELTGVADEFVDRYQRQEADRRARRAADALAAG